MFKQNRNSFTNDFDKEFNLMSKFVYGMFVFVALLLICGISYSIFFQKEMYSECLKEHSKHYCMKEISSHRIDVMEERYEK